MPVALNLASLARARVRFTPSLKTLAAVALAVTATFAEAAPPLYRISTVLVPAPRGGTTFLIDLNNAGQAIGQKSGRTQTALQWSTVPNTVTALPRLIRNGSTMIAGINDLGAAVGEAESKTGDVPVMWTTQPTVLPPYPGRSPSGFATRINNAGTAIGRVSGDPAVWFAGASVPTSVGSLPRPDSTETNCDLTSINDTHDVAGFCLIDASGPHSVLWNAASGLVDLGSLPGHGSSQALDINNSQQVLGISFPGSGGQRAYVWSPDTGMVDLGSVPGFETVANMYPRRINDLGTVIGTFQDATDTTHSFVWTKADGMTDLITLIDPTDPLKSQVAWVSGISINDTGDILAIVGLRHSLKAVVLTPVPN